MRLSNLLITADVDSELSKQPDISLLLRFLPYCFRWTFTNRLAKDLKLSDVKAEHVVVKSKAVGSG